MEKCYHRLCNFNKSEECNNSNGMCKPKIISKKILIIPSLMIVDCGKCPFNKYHDGRGHCDDWNSCSLTGKSLEYSWYSKFPDFCPLKEIQEEKTEIIVDIKEYYIKHKKL